MVVGLIDDIPSCAELLERMVTECHQRLGTASGHFG
jgi:nitronate monooxygenase